jgi:hypothetical protein
MGLSETEVSELQTIPTRSPSTSAVTMEIPVIHPLISERKERGLIAGLAISLTVRPLGLF